MKICQRCGQSVAEEIRICPACGGEVGAGRQYIDDYRIEAVLHEGYASMLCRAVKDGYDTPVMIRIFTPQSGVDEEIAGRLKRELEEIRKLPAEDFVRHLEIKRSFDGVWYRVSEWIETESWGDLFRSGAFNDSQTALAFFTRIALALETLHRSGHFIPHLILNDIMVVRDETGQLRPRIDYKLSRFFDPKLDRPGPMLKRLISLHPDILHERPLDFRSDIWSLGKIFVEILTADQEASDLPAKIEELPLPAPVAVLLRTMLADDPDLRPRTMHAVAEALKQVSTLEIEAARKKHEETVSVSVKSIRRLKRRQFMLAALLVLLMAAGGLLWFQLGAEKKKSTALLEGYANRYAPSAAFVVVEYWLKEGQRVLYRNRTEGTAFLADARGYLLTNRHVACPWLEDETLQGVIGQFRSSGRSAEFDFRMYLWFEGQRAFKYSAGLLQSEEAADAYFVESAFRTDGEPAVRIAGVARPPVQTRQLAVSPLRDDFAVLKIDRVPQGLKPLPLDLELDPRRIPKLSPAIVLGFPLGSRSQEAAINVSVSRGHVRRSFENLIHVDMPFFGGDSGGPIIDMRGKVIGIASGVAVRRAPGIFPMVTPLWNLALVLPINKAAAFLKDLKAGAVKWNGMLDLALEERIRRITDLAGQRRWVKAMETADEELRVSQDPALVMAAAMAHYCSGDGPGAERLFGQALSVNPENNLARLMLIFTARQSGRRLSERHGEPLLALDWRAPDEFLGYVYRFLGGRLEEQAALHGWETDSERSWLHYVAGFLKVEEKKWVEAELLLRQAVLAAESIGWEFYLGLSALERVERARLEALQPAAAAKRYEAEVEAFQRSVTEDQAAKDGLRTQLGELAAALQSGKATPQDQVPVLEKIHDLRPSDGDILALLAFQQAMTENWPEALDRVRVFLRREGRESAARLKLGLLEAGILHRLGKTEEARKALEAFGRRTRDPWYQALCDHLLDRRTLESLAAEAGERPENLLTLNVALGFRAEASGSNQAAIEYYKKALESLLDDWLEFVFAKERIRRLTAAAG